jgi:hypothetical protein
MIFSYIAGVGGTDVDPEAIEKIALDVMKRREPVDTPVWIME